MNKKLKKRLFGAMTLTMAFGLAACGGVQEKSSAPDTAVQSTPLPSGEPSKSAAVADGAEGNIFVDSQSGAPKVTVLLPCPDDDLHKTPNQWYDKLIAEINEYTGTNVAWKWYYSHGTTYYEQQDREILSGELAEAADVIWVKESDVFWEAAEKGMFWDLSPYIDGESYDNFAAMPEAERMGAYRDGKMYGIPITSGVVDYCLFYRTNWLENLGMEAPTDWESFCKMLYAFTYEDPDRNGKDDTVGLFLDDKPSRRGELLDAMESWFGVPNVWGIDEDGNLIHKTRTEEYKEAYAALRELYAQGVINNGANGITDFRELAGKESMESDELTARTAFETFLAGAVVESMDNMIHFRSLRDNEQYTEEDMRITYGIQPCVDTGRGTLCYPSLGGRLLAVSKERVTDEEQLKTVLQFINDVDDGSCYELIHYGWEEINFTLDERGYVKNWRTHTKELVNSGIIEYSHGFTYLPLGYVAEENARKLYYDFEGLPGQVLERKIIAENKDRCVINYGAQFVSETYEEKGTELDEMLYDAEVRYMTGELDEAGFEAALKSWWENGGESITRELNEKYHAAGY